jgi:hypothetical protein
VSAPTSIEWLRAAVGRVAVGSERLAVHYARRLAARARAWYARVRDWLNSSTGLGWWAKAALLALALILLRKIVTGMAAAMYRRIESGTWSWMLWPAVIIWLIAAYRAGRPGWTPKTPAAAAAEEPEPQDDEQTNVASDTAEQQPAQPRVPTGHALAAAVRAIGTPHAHIAALAEHLHTTAERVREGCAAAGIPVGDVRMRGRGASTGVRGDALPALLDRAPSGVVGAGEPANNDNNNTSAAPLEKGLRVEYIGQAGAIVRHPADAVRHHEVRDH